MPKPSFNLLIICILMLFIVRCGVDRKHSTSADARPFQAEQASAYEVTIVPSGQGWGYQISHNNSVVINQLTIPAISGRHPFVSEAEATKTAALVVHKLNNGQMPPSVTAAELDSLGITY